MARAVGSLRYSIRAISAPRSQRVWKIPRSTPPWALRDHTCASRTRQGRPGAMERRIQRPRRRALVVSTSLTVCLTSRSSAANSSVIRCAVAEQPASLSSSA